jgi:putative transposase
MSQLNKLSAEVWNFCLELDKKYKEETGKQIGLSEIQKRTKGIVPLHAKGIHHVTHKYLFARSAMWNSRKAKHKDSRKVELPYKTKKYFNTGWDYQSIKVDYKKNRIYLSRQKPEIGRNPAIICRVKNPPKNIVEIELIYKGRLYLAIKYKEPDINNVIQSENAASIDLGEIHAITSIDNNGNTVIITNRKIRSLVRLKDKKQGKLKSLRSKCKKGSKQYNKFTKAIYKIKYDFDRKINDAIHKQTKLYLIWCLQHDIKTVYYGNVDSTTRNTSGKMSHFTNHKLNMWRYGQLTKQLENKLNRWGIDLICVSEAYSTKTCPNCKTLNKTKNRNYACQCGYTQHRDIVGAINILSMNSPYKITRYNKKEYLQIK